MPANFIPISAVAGKLFAKMSTEPGKYRFFTCIEIDGLVAIFDLKGTKASIEPTTFNFNSQGDALLITDTRNQAAFLQLAQNRYSIVANNFKGTISNCIFLGGNPLNPPVLIIEDKAKQINVHEATSGKVVQ